MKIAISACLQGCEVRYDGTGKLQAELIAELKDIVEVVSFCPEVDAGLGIPREPIQLVEIQSQAGSDIRVLQVSDAAIDRTEVLRLSAQRQGWLASISGYIFKARSPSCGVASTPVWSQTGETVTYSDGEFVRCIRARYPQMPLIDEEQWRDAEAKAAFLAAAYAYNQNNQNLPAKATAEAAARATQQQS